MKATKRGMIAVVLAVLFATFLSLSVQAQEGCYAYSGAAEDLYCVPGILQEEAAADCGQFTECSVREHFIAGSDCSAIPECEVVTCSTDCQQHALGICERLGGEAVADAQFNQFCNPGCCKIADRFCQFGLNQQQCTQRAQQLGYAFTDSNVLYSNPSGMTLDQCNQQYCQVDIQPASLAVAVKDEANAPVSGAQVELTGTAIPAGTTANNGQYLFASLAPSSYSVRASKDGYAPGTAAVSLIPGQQATIEITLPSTANFASVSGTIRSSSGTAVIQGATVSWRGPSQGQVLSDSNGRYEISALTPGGYTLTASKVGFSPAEQAITVEAGASIIKDFTLQPGAMQGISGTTYVDTNGNGRIDQHADPERDEGTYGVRLFVDGVFKGFSRFPAGNFGLTINVQQQNEQHAITATYQNYQAEETVTISPGQLLPLNLLLTTTLGECSADGPSPRKNVEHFSLRHIPGEKAVRAEWSKPCPEVVAYSLEKRDANGEVLETPRLISPARNSRVDRNVEWGESYTYAIRALYDGSRQSEQAGEQSITLGNAACEGKFHGDTGWESFCRIGSLPVRKTIYTCTDENQLTENSCAERDGPGESYFCSQVSSRTAECVNGASCSLFGDPFGLYYSRSLCYGAADPEQAVNYCTYDATDSIVNECKACTSIESCFGYRSEDACRINNCLSAECQWVPSAANEEPLVDYSAIGLSTLPAGVTQETGQGYCVETEYESDDQCSLCSSSAGLFENAFCSAEVCTALGRCFADNSLDFCTSCGDVPSRDSSCYSYSSALECVGGGGVSKDPYGMVEFSADSCSWKRCAWNGPADSFSPGACVKDGDADGQDDCASLATAGERNNCRLDISPPRTSIERGEGAQGIPVISSTRQSLGFLGDDSFHTASTQRAAMGVLGFCISSAEPNAPDRCLTDDYAEILYPGRQQQELLEVNLLNSSFLQRPLNGETVRLQLYSKDKSRNQEALQEVFIFVDNVAPAFELNEEIATIADRSTLTVYLEGLAERASCSFALKGIVPQSAPVVRQVSADAAEKQALFESLPGVLYELNATCTDVNGNSNSRLKRYTFDLEERIDIIQPAIGSILSDLQLVFRAHTDVAAQCGLFESVTNQKIADFITDESGKEHHTAPVPGFVEGEYRGTHKIACSELLSEELFEDYFNFMIDFTPPETQIVLSEGARTERPAGFGWRAFFVESAAVSFECTSDGFSCESTRYCLGGGCASLRSNSYLDYTGTFEVNESTTICYYSVDEGSTAVYSPVCGTILVVGYGILLEKPPVHYFEEEQWGISNRKTFDWQFSTRVPTEECKFDFSPGFDYENLPGFKVLLPGVAGGAGGTGAEGKYLFTGFPQQTGAAAYPDSGGIKKAYVKCRNAEGEIGPEEKMNLEYDPTAPEIEKAEAEPELLLEGNRVQLQVETDDKTLCRYSDGGQQDYELMQFSFPGEAEKILYLRHAAPFTVSSFTGLKKEFSLTTQCRNGAGDASAVENIEFTVDYTDVGSIVSLWPDGDMLAVSSLAANVQTSKDAVCIYKVQNGTSLPLNSAGGRIHTLQLSNLQDGEYRFPVRCIMGDHAAEHAFTFTIDSTPPVVSSVDDGKYTCGRSELSVMAYTPQEANITAYEYQVLDAGEEPAAMLTVEAALAAMRRNESAMAANATNTINTIAPVLPPASPPRTPLTGIIVANATVPAELPIRIPLGGLQETHRYFVKVRAQDRAGNWGGFASGDGAVMLAANHSICAADTAAPSIRQIIDDNSSCSALFVALECDDDLGCASLKYGVAATEESCNAAQPYNGQKISFSSGGWLCYYAEDYSGKNTTAALKVQVPDEDGDGIVNSCDQCRETKAGEVADLAGCAFDEVPEKEQSTDMDNDGLPDYWERIHSSEECLLDYLVPDSDNDGIPDAEEDYDSDGFTNREELQLRQDPCFFDAALPEEEVPGEKAPALERKELPLLPPGEEGPAEKADLLAWILFILGLLLSLGGSGYLWYFYKLLPKGKRAAAPPAGEIPEEAPEEKPALPLLGGWQQKRLRERREHAKEKKRREVFGGFGKALERAVKKEPMQAVQEAAEKFMEHKEDVKPAKEDRDIFSKLSSIAKETAGGEGKEGKDISEVIGKKEAEDIFEKLKEINKKRKK